MEANMEPDWNFRVDDENAKYRVPPDDIRLPLEAAVAKLGKATEGVPGCCFGTRR